jgi:tetratricopeptide (TPR) repeat protein
LIELGYVDPEEVAAHEAARRQELLLQLRHAIDLNRQGRGQEAAAMLVKLAADDPEWVAPHQLLAEVYYSSGQWSAVEAQLEWLAHHGVDQPRVAIITAGLALARRKLLAALEDLEFARRADPNLPSVHTLTGTAFLRLGRWDEAEDAFREAATQDPHDARARDGLAAICLIHGENEDAADWALRALEQDMTLFHAHYHLGLALARMDRPHDAISALETAARLDGRRTAPFYWLSRITREQLSDARLSAEYRERAKQVIQDRRKRRQKSMTTSFNT